MNYKAKGRIIAIGDLGETKQGRPKQHLHFEQQGGSIMYPAVLGANIELLGDFLPGDVCEIEFNIIGYHGTFNNVVLCSITKI